VRDPRALIREKVLLLGSDCEGLIGRGSKSDSAIQRVCQNTPEEADTASRAWIAIAEKLYGTDEVIDKDCELQ
jgi:hypothetical protein